MLVHCHAGVSRSATVCIAYIMKNLDHDLRSAYDFVKARRPCVSPNLHFMGQLLEFEKRLGTRTTVDSFKLASVQEDCEQPHSLPASWVGKDKRRAVSTPSLELCSPTLDGTFCVTHRPPSLAVPINSSSLPNTPVTGLQIHVINSVSLPSTPVAGLQNRGSLPGKSLRNHRSHSCSLQSLAVHSPGSVAVQNCQAFCHRQVTESL